MMQVLKGKKKIIFFIILFLFLTSYEFNNENNLPLFRIKHIQFINNDNLEDNIKDKIINHLDNKSLLNINNNKISNFLLESQWVRNFKIIKNYPNRIVLQINEFKPIAVCLILTSLSFI